MLCSSQSWCLQLFSQDHCCLLEPCWHGVRCGEGKQLRNSHRSQACVWVSHKFLQGNRCLLPRPPPSPTPGQCSGLFPFPAGLASVHLYLVLSIESREIDGQASEGWGSGAQLPSWRERQSPPPVAARDSTQSRVCPPLPQVPEVRGCPLSVSDC